VAATLTATTDTCNASGVCQTNHEADDTACTSDGNDCTSDVCSGGVCTHPNEPEDTACGSNSDTDCDNRDTCNASGVCQTNHEEDDTACTSDGNACTEDVCDNGACTHPNEPAGTNCGSGSDSDCDNPDTCNGSGVCQTNREEDGTACTRTASLAPATFGRRGLHASERASEQTLHRDRKRRPVRRRLQ
jgi:hypothetical protein